MSRRLFGFHPVREALRHRPHEVAEVLLAAGRGGHRAGEIESLCARHGVPVRRVAAAVLRELAAGGVDNGFAANLRGDAIAGAAAGSDPGLQVLVEDVQDPRNLGALLRVCEGAGVRKVWIRDRGSAPLSAVAVKAAAGASEWLSIERVTNSARAIADAKAAGVCASSPAAAATGCSACRCGDGWARSTSPPRRPRSSTRRCASGRRGDRRREPEPQAGGITPLRRVRTEGRLMGPSLLDEERGAAGEAAAAGGRHSSGAEQLSCKQ